MQRVTDEVAAFFERRMDGAAVAERQRPGYRKWVGYYLDFCGKYGHPPRSASSIAPFLSKLASKQQTLAQQEQASVAVRLLITPEPALAQCAAQPTAQPVGERVQERTPERSTPGRREATGRRHPVEPVREPAGAREEPRREDGADGHRSQGVRDRGSRPPAPGRGASWEREYRELEGAIRLRNYSKHTLSAYRGWVRKFQGFLRSKPPGQAGPGDAKAFLTDLAVTQGVSASSQNQAFNALLFFFRHALGREFGKLDGVVRARRRPYVPSVLSRAQVDAVLDRLEPRFRLVAELLYGCGLRLSECLDLRVHCFDLDAMLLVVHDGKGQKDRTVPLPEVIVPEIRRQMEEVRRLHQRDLAAGYAGVFLPRQLEKKYKNAAREYIWQWFFPAPNLTTVPGTGERRRYHLHPAHVQAAVKQAATQVALPKRVSPHTFRHTFASHLLLAGYDLPTIQRLLGHGDIKTTMIYLQTVPGVTLKEARSPLDL